MIDIIEKQITEIEKTGKTLIAVRVNDTDYFFDVYIDGKRVKKYLVADHYDRGRGIYLPKEQITTKNRQDVIDFIKTQIEKHEGCRL